MKNRALKIFTFIIVTGIAVFLLGISIYIMDKQPYTYIDNASNNDIYALLGTMLLLAMPFLTFIMRSISNLSYAWILGIILVFVSMAALASFANSYYLVLAASYIICCLGIFVPVDGSGGGGGGGCNKYCDCCVGECY